MKPPKTNFITIGLTITIILFLNSCGSFGNSTSYLESTYTETTMPTEQTLELIPVTPTATNTPSLTLTPLPPTLTSTPPPTLSQTLIPDLNFRLTYLAYDMDVQNKIIGSQLWMVLPPYQQPLLVYKTRGEGEIVVGYSWARSGEILAVAISDNNEENESVRVEIFNLPGTQSFDLTELDLRENNELSLRKDAFSFDDSWININYIDYNQAALTSQIYAIKREGSSEALMVKGEFLSWSPVWEKQYAYLSREENITINLGEVGNDQSIASIDDFGDFTPIPFPLGFSWAQDGIRAIVPAFDQDGKTHYLQLDFQSEVWVKMFTSDQELSVFEQWSPDGKGLALYRYDQGLYFLNLDSSDSSLIKINADVSAFPIGWFPDSHKLIYQEGFSIYLVDPVSPQSPILLHNFSKLFQEYYPFTRIVIIP